MNNSNFVNESRNVVWLSGYTQIQEGDDGIVLLRQSANESRHIPFRLPKHMRLPSRNVPCEVKCHAFGYRDKDTGRSYIRLEAIHVKRASVTAVPRQRAMLNALRGKAAAADNPFASREQAIEEVKNALRLEAGAVEMLLADGGKRVVRDGFQNRAILSGFAGHKAFLPPADDGSGDLGSVQFLLQQHAEGERGLMVRVRGADARFSKELKQLHPLIVVAEIRVEPEVDDEGNIVARRLYLETTRQQVGTAAASEFSNRIFPPWWREAVSALYHQRKALDERSRAIGEQAAAARPVAPAPSVMAPAAPAAVAAPTPDDPDYVEVEE